MNCFLYFSFQLRNVVDFRNSGVLVLSRNLEFFQLGGVFFAVRRHGEFLGLWFNLILSAMTSWVDLAACFCSKISNWVLLSWIFQRKVSRSNWFLFPVKRVNFRHLLTAISHRGSLNLVRLRRVNFVLAGSQVSSCNYFAAPQYLFPARLQLL